MKSPSWGAPSGDTENSLWVAGGLAEEESRQAGPKAKEGYASWGRADAPGASTCRRAGRAAQVRKQGEGAQRALGARHGTQGSAGTRGAQGTAGARLRRRSQRGVASGRAAGRREPLTCAAEAELQQPMAGPEEPGGGAGRAATPRSPSACEPAGARGGRGLARHDSAATAATAAAARTQEAARFGAGAGHIPRRRRRLLGSGSAPAAAAAPQRKGAGGGGGTSPWPPPPTTRAQSLSRSLSRAAAASSSAPRASPIRLPAPSAAPRRADGGATAARTRPGPWARAGACAAPGPFRGGTEAALCLGARGRLRPKLPRTGRARSRNAADLLPDARGTGRSPGVAPSPGWARHRGHCSEALGGSGGCLCYPEESVHAKPPTEKEWVMEEEK